MVVVDQSKWRYIITDMNGATNTGGGEIQNAIGKQFADNLNAAKTAQCTINIENPLADFAMNNDTLLRVFRKNRLNNWINVLNGEVISTEEDGTGGDTTGTITIMAADPWWRIQRRFIGTGTTPTGAGQGFTYGTNSAPVDVGAIAQQILQTVITLFPIGFTITEVQTIGTNSYLGPVYVTNAMDALLQLCNTTGGPEIEFVPIDPITGLMPNTQICTAHIRAIQGGSRPNCVFEYGTGRKNVATYSRIRTKDGQANLVYSPPQGFPSAPAAGDSMVWAQDTASMNARGLFQDVIQSDVASVSLRQELCNEYVAVRTGPRQQLNYVPRNDVELDYTVDYGVGDVVTARAWVVNSKGQGEYRFNGTTRIYGVSFTVDENDSETPNLTLIPSTG